jgi:hypothetical protein
VSELRVTRPCRKCSREPDCAAFIGELRALVADHDANTKHALPDVVVECVYYTVRWSGHEGP